MELFPEFFDQKLLSVFGLFEFEFGLVVGFFEFGNFFDADGLHFLIVFLESLEVSFFGAHFGFVVFLKILAFFEDEDLFGFVLFFIDF